MSLEALVSVAESGPWCAFRAPGRIGPHLGLSVHRPPPLAEPGSEAAGPYSQPWRERAGSYPWQQADPEPIPWREIFGPVPDPWRVGVVEVGLYGAINLYQMGRRLSGPTSQAFTAAGLGLLEETCGNIPLSELLWILLHRPPPPPPPWWTILSFQGETLAFAQATEQEQLAAAATREITKSLNAFGLQRERGHQTA